MGDHEFLKKLGLTLPDSYGEFQKKRFAGKPQHLRDVLGDGCEYPLACDDEKRMRRCLASYYGLISAIDMEIGKVIDALEASGELDNTIVIYTADHGDFAGEHGLFHKNLGLYEAVQRIPYLLSYPGGPRGETSTKLVESVDVFPTLFDLCDVPMSGKPDGVSLLKILNGEVTKEAAFCEWEMFWPEPHRVSAIRTDGWRLVYYDRYNDGELYDRENDPGEVSNRWNDPGCVDVKAGLMQRLLAFSMTYGVKTNVADDIQKSAADRGTPARRIHTEKARWSELRLDVPNLEQGEVA